MQPQPTHICYVVKTDNYEPEFHKGQRIEAVETFGKIPYCTPILFLSYGKLYFGYTYPSKQRGYYALINGRRDVTHVKRDHKQKRYLILK